MSGKTTGIITPTVMLAPGACVSSPIKSDVMNQTAAVRAGFTATASRQTSQLNEYQVDEAGEPCSSSGVAHCSGSRPTSYNSSFPY